MAAESQSAPTGDVPLEIEPVDLDRMRREGAPHAVVDVREIWELEICALPDILHVPLADLPARFGELPVDRPLIVVCRTGRRSLQATLWLRAQGYANSSNLRGGVHLWSDQIDPTMRKY